jgi:NADH:ubiquinone oxidoreductase subunit F (NADH-binding)
VGEDIFGSGFCFDVEVRMGAGAFVCGEETALIASIEGQRATRATSRLPGQQGLWVCPTVGNNVETWPTAHHSAIGRGVVRMHGHRHSKGTKVFRPYRRRMQTQVWWKCPWVSA